VKIIGAGLAGLLAAHMMPEAEIFEANEKLQRNHYAVLRHRSAKISVATGIPFKEIDVIKSIWFDNQHTEPNIKICNLYSRKVANMVAKRSIWSASNLDWGCSRYLAPDNFINKLAAPIMDRIHFDYKVSGQELKEDDGEPVISTIPLPVLADLLGVEKPKMRHTTTPIVVKRYRVPAVGVYQTIYYPELHNPIYRATLHDNLLIAEGLEEDSRMPTKWRETLSASFGMDPDDMIPAGTHSQKYGKIVPIDDKFRKSFILHATMKYNIWSLGRFATWRNILLDEVHDDVLKIKGMLSQHKYDIKLESIK